MDGGHSIETCFTVTERTLRSVFAELARHRVPLEAILLKPNMVIPGKKHPQQASPQQVAEATVRCFQPHGAGGGARHRLPVRRSERRGSDREPRRHESVGPAAVAAQLLLRSRAPGFGARGVEGQAANVAAAQRAFHHRAKLTSAARDGRYEAKMEKIAV